MTKKNIDKVIRIESIADLENYNLTNYINFVRRSGGQLFQHYSLLDSYSKYLGYSNGNEYSTAYKETEVLFSREIYKRRVYSSVILPLYIEDFSSNDFSFDSSKTATGAAKSFFQGQLTPSWYDRHQNDFAMLGGELRNVYKNATSRPDSFISTGITLVGGELRLPLLRYYHREWEANISSFAMLGGELKKVLLKANMRPESFKSETINPLYFGKSTSVANDVLEINFKSLVTPEESPKTYSTILDSYSTVADDRVFKTEKQSIRILNKAGGFRANLRDDSTSIYCNYNWTLSLNFYPRELAQSSVVYHYNNFCTISLGQDDPSILEVRMLHGNNLFRFRSLPGTLSINSWYEIAIECYERDLCIYLNNSLLQLVEDVFPSDLKIFNINEAFYLGNDNTALKGFIGNIDHFTFIKKVAKLSEVSPIPKQINSVLASKLLIDEFGNILDENPNTLWAFQAKPNVDIEEKRIELGSSRYLEASLSENLSVYTFNNYRISIEFAAISLPSLSTIQRTLLHKTGALDSESDNSYRAGYHLGIKRIDDTTKIVFNLGSASLVSTAQVKARVKYKVDIYKYKKYLFMFVDGVFEASTEINFNLEEDIMSDLLIGRFRTRPEYDFQGYVYDFSFENYFKDADNLLTRYLPENISLTSVLNFENDLFDEGDPKRIWNVSGESLSTFRTVENKKFGDYSLKLSDDNSYITAEREPVFNLGMDDFTVETWIYITAYNTFATLLSNGVTSTDNYKDSYRLIYINAQGKLIVGGSQAGLNSNSPIIIESGNAVPLNSWIHIAVTREKGTFRTYLNGVKNKQVIYNNTILDFSANGTFIGINKWDTTATTQLKANLDSFRLVKGKALYVGDSFVLPDKPFGSLDTNKIVDLNFEPNVLPPQKNPQLLLNFDPVYENISVRARVLNSELVLKPELNTENIDTFILNFEEGFKNEGNFVIPLVTNKTNIEDPVFQTSKVRFGSKAVKLESKMMTLTGQTTANNIFMFGSEDFSIDFWTYETSRAVGDYRVIFSSILLNTALVYSYNNNFGISIGGEGNLSWTNDNTVRPLNKWNHVVYSRKGTDLFLFCNGILKSTKKISKDTLINNLGITGTNFGGSAWTSSDCMIGFLDGFRVVRGYSLFTEEYDPDMLEVPREGKYSLLGDEYLYAKGAIVVDSETKEFHKNSIKFSGFSPAINPFFDVLIKPREDFTLELNILFRESSFAEEIILSNVVKEGYEEEGFRLSRVSGLLSIFYNDVLILEGSSTLNNNVWYNVTLTRSKDLLKIFIDGMLDSRDLKPTLSIDFRNLSLKIGEQFKGNIESLRFTPGLSLYKNSYQTPNIYFDKTNRVFNVTFKSYTKVIDSTTKALIHSLDLPLQMRLAEENDKSYLESQLLNKNGIVLTDPLNATVFNGEDFNISYKARLKLDKTFDIFKGVDNPQNYNKSIYSAITSTYDNTYRNSVIARVNGIVLVAGFTESLLGVWLEVKIERKESTLNLYVNGSLRDSKLLTDPSVNLKHYGNNFWIARNPDGSSFDIEYFYVNKGSYLYKTENDSRPNIVDVFEEKIEIIKPTPQNLIPDNSYFENIVDSFITVPKVQDFVMTNTVESIHNFSSYFNGVSYLRLENFPELPASLIIDFWVFPLTADSTFIKVSQSDTDLTKGITIRETGGFLNVYIKSDTNISLTLISAKHKILYGEWNAVRLLFKEGVLNLYLNGEMIKEEKNSNPAFYKGLLGRLYLGYDPSTPTKYFKGYLDSVTIDRATLNSPYGYLKYSPYQEMFLKFSSNIKEIVLTNAEADFNSVGWDILQGDIVVLDGADRKYFYNKPSVNISRVYQDIDLSIYNKLEGKELYLSWTQIKDVSSSLESKGRLALEFFDEYNNSISFKRANNISMYSKDKGLERYLTSKIPTSCVTIRLHLELRGGEGITGINLFSEDLGDKFFNKSSDGFEEFIPKGSFKEPSYAYRYISSDGDISSRIKEDLIEDVTVEPIYYKVKDNLLYSNVYITGIKEEITNENTIIIS